MDFYYDFLTPVNANILQFVSELPQGTIGKNIKIIQESTETELQPKSIVLLGVPEDRGAIRNEGAGKDLDSFRKEFYALYSGNWTGVIYDFGDLKVGESFQDTLVIVQEIVVGLLRSNQIPVIIGGSQALTYAIYRAYDQMEKRVNLTAIDAKFDLGMLENPLDSASYLTKIIMDKPNNLNNYTNLAYQTFLNAQDEIHLMDGLLFDTYRLGNLKKDIELSEPVLRETDLLSIDIGVVRAADAPANCNKMISGLNADEICQISRYAGLSDKLNIFSIFEYNSKYDIHNQTAQLLAQMVWYFIEGFHLRKPEFPNVDLNGFKKYMVMIDDETFQFYKSESSERWWMEISLKEDNKIKRQTLIPCTYNDFLTANRLEIPERWYINRRKLG
jgi:formiminoglutamase